jgi:sulfite exporter TauE/SafE
MGDMPVVNTYLLGLSVGGGCLAQCGPALLPILLCEERRRWKLAAAFLASRLFGYASVALLLFLLGRAAGLAEAFRRSALPEGLVLLILGGVLVRHGLRLKRRACGDAGCAAPGTAKAFGRFRDDALLFACRAGFLTALGLCAPMLAFATQALTQSSPADAALSLAGFFMGTTTVLLPLFIGGFACKGAAVRQIGFLCGLLAGAMYLFQGSFIIITEVVHACS